ncbi:orotate phosphoribosyltransferase [Antricoccus suffuscus]|uniref:Orotate phosphoribosyltransferase n=1 Tax=Antricoccus suffuscus TaxID=1629062 RepID=A0A2T0Z9C8_9ACTN|nr:orotate phosphoribosyltransferase [Antricoccus suffuscus]PRZ32764.1 orotate phosphoribosyltransferase [Antricoccus suffuscus]
MTDRARLLELVNQIAVVRGDVTLSSGQKADRYVDLRRITLHHEGGPLVGRVMLEVTKHLDFDVVGGLTLGADPVATAMMHAAAAQGRALDACVVRKEKKAHGMQRQIEGPGVEGRKVLAVDDTSTTGNSVLQAVDALREAGADVVGVGLIVDRGAHESIEMTGLGLSAVFRLEELDIG